MTDQAVLYDFRDGVAWLTLNRPAALNAIDPSLIGGMIAGMDRAAADKARVLVLTGNGRAFCAGADLKHFHELVKRADPDETNAFIVYSQSMMTRLSGLTIPVIAAINGFAVAGGVEIMLCCDLAIAAESAKIGDGHANYGLLPGAGGAVRLPRRIGPMHAKYLMFTGDLLPAKDCLALGLVNQVVPDADLKSATAALAAKIASKSPLVLARMKALVADCMDQPVGPALRLERVVWEAHQLARDLDEGLAAFGDKRKPSYSGA